MSRRNEGADNERRPLMDRRAAAHSELEAPDHPKSGSSEKKVAPIDAAGLDPLAIELAEMIHKRDEDGASKLERLGGVQGVLSKLHSDGERGLADNNAAAEQRKRLGANALPAPPTKPFWRLLLAALSDRVLLLLAVAAAVSLALGLAIPGERKTGWMEGAAILAAVALVSLVTAGNDYFQELRFRELNAQAEDRQVTVLRGGRTERIGLSDVVVGDVLPLEVGDSAPADGLVVQADALRLDESALTGESGAVTKQADGVPQCMVLAGTKVLEGRGRMVATAVGAQTEMGRIRALLQTTREPTPLQQQLAGLASRVGKLGLTAAILTLLALCASWTLRNYWEAHQRPKVKDLLVLLKFVVAAVSLVVVAVPEGLPLAVTLALAYSMRRMSRENCLVRRLEACETMGRATCICTDKTGTLTENRMAAQSLALGRQLQPQDAAEAWGTLSDPAKALLAQAIAANSTAFLRKPGEKDQLADGTGRNQQQQQQDQPRRQQQQEQPRRQHPQQEKKKKNKEEEAANGEGSRPEVVGSRTEGALLLFLQDAGGDYERERAGGRVAKQWPFSSASKRMATLWQPAQGQPVLHVKGAAELLLPECQTAMQEDGQSAPLQQEAAQEAVRSMASQGLRALALAYSPQPPSADGEEAPRVPLTLVALVGIADPLRADVPDAVKLCRAAGVRVRMLTGDNALTAAAIARGCGILNAEAGEGDGEGAVREGPAIRNLDDAALDALLPDLRVLARASPEDKHRLVQRLRAMGEVVAVTGDGTNDAPQLREADVGFAMGIQGTEVAKEAADIVLLDDNFRSITVALKWGRNVFDAIRKFLQFQLTINAVAVVLALVGAALADETPLTAIQMLWLNLVMDTFAALALATEAPSDALMKRPPHGRREKLITRKMWRFMVGHALYQLAVLGVLMYVPGVLPGSNLAGARKRWTPQQAAQHRTLVFNTFVLLQLSNLWNARKLLDEWNPFSGAFSSWLFWVILVGVAVVQVLLVQFGGTFMQTAPLALTQWGLSLALGLTELPYGLLVRRVPISNKAPAAAADGQRDSPALEEGRDAPLSVSERGRSPRALWQRARARTRWISTFRRPRYDDDN